MDIHGPADLEKKVTETLWLIPLSYQRWSNVPPSTEHMADVAIRARRFLDIEQPSSFKTPRAH